MFCVQEILFSAPEPGAGGPLPPCLPEGARVRVTSTEIIYDYSSR
jgi:hypothetical protein